MNIEKVTATTGDDLMASEMTKNPMPKLRRLSAGAYETTIDGVDYMILKFKDGWLWRNSLYPAICAEWKWTKNETVTNLFHYTNDLRSEAEK